MPVGDLVSRMTFRATCKAWGWGLPGLLLLALLGCRTDPRIELLERELRWQEDQIYKLQWEKEELEKMLYSTKEHAIEKPSYSKKTTKPVEEEVLETLPPYKPPTLDSPDRDEPMDRDYQEEIDPPPFELPPSLQGQLDSPPVENPSTNSSEASEGELSEIAFNSRLTGGWDSDGFPGDEGIMVVVEPRDPSGKLLKIPGEIGFVVTAGEETEGLDRWDFTSENSVQYYKKTLFGEGYHFQLPWSQQPPNTEELTLHARFITADGRELRTAQAIKIEPPMRR
ncbi:Hypothetical protein PBC10988_14060 [Planctomycetales bacterium 10988]|nr:Hypothetical protein PBC10988_14060 [Planctomycetales bacterium 10988]